MEVKAEHGEIVVPNGGDGDADGGEDGDGDEVKAQPPPPQPAVLSLPLLVRKALGKNLAVCREAAAAPSSAQVLEQGCGP